MNKRFFAADIVCSWLFISLGITSVTALASENTTNLDNLLSLSLEELLNQPIESTSYFTETPFNVAATVTIITPEEWENRGARRLNDALLHLPSVVSLPNFLGQDSVRIRGYAQSDARGIATLWDGVSISSFNLGTSDVDRPNIQLNTLNSIEVTRGPGSALYGSDAFHGVVSLQSFDSDKDLSNVMFRYGDNGFYTASYKTSQALNKDWRFNTAISSSGQPDQNLQYDYIGGTGERDYNFQSTTFVAKFISDTDKPWSYKIGFYYDKNDTNNFHGEGRQAGGAYPVYNDVASVKADFKMIKVDISRRLSSTSSLTLQNYYWDQHHEFDRPALADVALHFNGDEHRSETKLIYKNEKLTENTQLSAALGIRHDEIDLQHLTRFNTTTSTTLADFDLPFSGVDRDIHSLMLDAKTSLPQNHWTFRYGLRLDDYSDFGSHSSPRFGAIYQINETSVFKALYGSSYRAATAVEVGGSPFIAGDPDIKPEELDTYELIYLKQTSDSKVEITLFKNEWTNGISTIDTNNDTFDDAYANITNNHAQGIEITYLKNIERWLLESSASYTESRSDTDETDYVAFPKYILTIGLGYSFTGNWLIYLNNRFYYDYYEGPVRNAIEPDKLDDYARTDLHISKEYKNKWEFFANIRNLFNQKNNLPSLVNMDYGIPEPGISLDAGAKFKF